MLAQAPTILLQKVRIRDTAYPKHGTRRSDPKPFLQRFRNDIKRRKRQKNILYHQTRGAVAVGCGWPVSWLTRVLVAFSFFLVVIPSAEEREGCVGPKRLFDVITLFRVRSKSGGTNSQTLSVRCVRESFDLDRRILTSGLVCIAATRVGAAARTDA